MLVDYSDEQRQWDVHKLEANAVRTVLIPAMLRTQTAILRSWIRGCG